MKHLRRRDPIVEDMLVRTSLALLCCALPALAQYDQHAKFQPPGLGSGDHFGIAVAANNPWLVTGAPWDDDQGADAGAVYVTTQPGGVHHAKLVATNASPGDHLGGSVDVHLNWIAAGMHDTSTNTRSVYVFDAASGAQVHELQAPVPAADDGFGSSVGISDSYVLVAAPDDDEGALNSGAVYVYDTQSGAFLFKRKADPPVANAHYGLDVALDGNIAVIGEPGYFGSLEGRVHLLDLTVNFEAGMIASPCGCLGGFGTSVAVDIPHIVVQSPGNERVYVFDLGGTPKLELAPPGPSTGFGHGIAVSGTRVVVGHQDTFGIGTAYVFDSNDGRMIDVIQPSDLVNADLYASAVAANVWGAHAGAPGNDAGSPQAGAVYTFRYGGCPQNRYCSPALFNSSGFSALIDADGCDLGGSVNLIATQLPPNVFGYLLIGNGNGVIQPPGSGGRLCLGGSTPAPGRYVADVGSAGPGGMIVTDVVSGVTGGGAGQLPSPPGGLLQPGDSWNFQLWFRDGNTSNLTDAITILFE